MSNFIFRIFRSYTTFCLFALISALCFSSLGKCKKLVDKFHNVSLINHMVMMYMLDAKVWNQQILYHRRRNVMAIAEENPLLNTKETRKHT